MKSVIWRQSTNLPPLASCSSEIFMTCYFVLAFGQGCRMQSYSTDACKNECANLIVAFKANSRCKSLQRILFLVSSNIVSPLPLSYPRVFLQPHWDERGHRDVITWIPCLCPLSFHSLSLPLLVVPSSARRQRNAGSSAEFITYSANSLLICSNFTLLNCPTTKIHSFPTYHLDYVLCWIDTS